MTYGLHYGSTRIFRELSRSFLRGEQGTFLKLALNELMVIQQVIRLREHRLRDVILPYEQQWAELMSHATQLLYLRFR